MWQNNNPGESSQPQDFAATILMEQLNVKINNLENLIDQLTKSADNNYRLFENLQKNIREFLEKNREDDKIEFHIDEANSFLDENSIEPLKRLYLVQFRIEGEIEVEAENEDKAYEIFSETLDNEDIVEGRGFEVDDIVEVQDDE